MRRRGFTAVEAVLVLVVLAIVVSVTMAQVDKRRQASLREESAENLRTLYRSIIPDPAERIRPVSTWPLSSTIPGQLAPSVNHVFMGRLQKSNNPTAFISPAHPNAERMRGQVHGDPESGVTDDSYWYLGYVLPDEKSGLAFVSAYKKAVRDTGKPPNEDRITSMPYDGARLVRADLLFIRGYGSLYDVPIFIERPGLQRGGSNVLFLDGTVEFIPYPGKWPMTEKFITALESLDELKEKK